MVTVFDFSNLVETDELEFKAAQGQNGKGEVPKDFWETYSAFANTNGGTVLLGIQENKDYSFNVL
ncbi:MAG: helix-turn-helix domain-containing protein [Candidatus Kapaibacteriota bacterium]